MKKVEPQPIEDIIATFRTTKQIGPDEWDVYPVSQIFPATTTLNHVCEWFYRNNPYCSRIEHIDISQPLPFMEKA